MENADVSAHGLGTAGRVATLCAAEVGTVVVLEGDLLSALATVVVELDVIHHQVLQVLCGKGRLLRGLETRHFLRRFDIPLIRSWHFERFLIAHVGVFFDI